MYSRGIGKNIYLSVYTKAAGQRVAPCLGEGDRNRGVEEKIKERCGRIAFYLYWVLNYMNVLFIENMNLKWKKVQTLITSTGCYSTQCSLGTWQASYHVVNVIIVTYIMYYLLILYVSITCKTSRTEVRQVHGRCSVWL